MFPRVVCGSMVIIVNPKIVSNIFLSPCVILHNQSIIIQVSFLCALNLKSIDMLYRQSNKSKQSTRFLTLA